MRWSQEVAASTSRGMLAVMNAARSVRRSTLVAYATATLAVPATCLAVLAWGPIETVQAPALPASETTLEVPAFEVPQPRVRGDVEAIEALAGIWWKQLPDVDGSPVAFYYFHGDGKGLYRYGRVGLSNTHSFDYDVVDGELLLRFRKTGEQHQIAYRTEHEGARDWLTLDYDPQEEAHGTRYFREQPGPIDPHGPIDAAADLGPAPAGHMWIDLKRHATGGYAFSMYQFRPAGIDGRGVGWFHRGDFDDWSTESFTYRIANERIDVHFTLADQGELTPFVVETGQPRTLRLEADPRDYWRGHRYQDMGPSFGSADLLYALDIAREFDKWRAYSLTE